MKIKAQNIRSREDEGNRCVCVCVLTKQIRNSNFKVEVTKDVSGFSIVRSFSVIFAKSKLSSDIIV